MSLAALTAKLKYGLKHMCAGSRYADLGERLGAYETYGIVNHNYAGAHADKVLTVADLPITSVVCIMLTNADDAANLILPATLRKAYIVYNSSGQVITAKVAGQAGTALANGGKYLCATDGTDIVTFQPEVTLAGAQTLINKTLTSPIINTPTITDPSVTLGAASHDYDGAAVDWMLSAAELKKGIIKATNANGAVNAIVADAANVVYVVVNGAGHNLTVKTAAGNGIAVETGKVALVMSDGTDVIRVAPDA